MRWMVASSFLVLMTLLAPAAPAESALDDSSTGEADFAPLHAGSVAPEFAERDIYGRQLIDLQEYRGKVVMLNFWATWCPPCRQEIPALEDLQRAYADTLAVIGASVYCSNTDTERFVVQYKINYAMIYGSYDLMGKYGKVGAIPTTFLIDRDGKVAARIVGARTESEYEALLKPLLPK